MMQYSGELNNIIITSMQRETEKIIAKEKCSQFF